MKGLILRSCTLGLEGSGSGLLPEQRPVGRTVPAGLPFYPAPTFPINLGRQVTGETWGVARGVARRIHRYLLALNVVPFI